VVQKTEGATAKWRRSPSESSYSNRATQRVKAVEYLIKDALSKDSRSRIIVFHESISEVMELFARLRRLGYNVIAEH